MLGNLYDALPLLLLPMVLAKLLRGYNGPVKSMSYLYAVRSVSGSHRQGEMLQLTNSSLQRRCRRRCTTAKLCDT